MVIKLGWEKAASFLKVFKSYRFIFSDYIKILTDWHLVDCEVQETIWTPRPLGAENETLLARCHHRHKEKLITTLPVATPH